MSSGVKGFTTIHAGSARQALTRLRFICQLSEVANELPMSALNTLVSESVDFVVHCARGARGPYVSEIVAVEDLAGSPDAAQFTVTELFHRDGPDAPLRWTGSLPVRAARLFRAAGLDLTALLGETENAGSAPSKTRPTPSAVSGAGTSPDPRPVERATGARSSTPASGEGLAVRRVA